MKAENISARLMAHAGAVTISRGDLLSLNTPPRTLTHTPLAHADLITYIETRLADHGITIDKGQFAVMSDGMKLFATLVLKRAKDEFALALGLRASNDKTMPIELVAGASVFVCDNMMLCGDAEIMCRKHTSRLNPRQEIFAGVDRAISRFTLLETRIKGLMETTITDNEAKANIFDAVNRGIILPKLLPVVGKEYFEPRHKEFEPRTLYSLHNAYTEVFKTLRPNQALDATQELGTLFSI